ncbi:hypothetical protein HNQ84_000164 [Anoxybacillus eryuanensis]
MRRFLTSLFLFDGTMMRISYDIMSEKTGEEASFWMR